MSFFLQFPQASCKGMHESKDCKAYKISSLSPFFFVFHELEYRHKPRLYLSDVSDMQLFVDANRFTLEKNIQIDGAFSSRVYTSLAELSRIVESNDQLTPLEQNLRDVLTHASYRKKMGINSCGII